MTLYRIVGLTVKTSFGHSYKTSPYSNKILHDETGKGITKLHEFTIYIVYISFENAYYAIHLSESHFASFDGKLCTIGNMSIIPSHREEVITKITHTPLSNLNINGPELNEEYDEVFVCLDNDPHTCAFKYSNYGKDERTPFGYVYVNMELFYNLEYPR
jgi:hypothetical protein